jgi:NAD(P)-dependent dehydrogenase (short-subunit alcohol dehydrogenase family)
MGILEAESPGDAGAVAAEAVGAGPGRRITVSTLTPGRMETPMTERLDRSIATRTGRVAPETPLGLAGPVATPVAGYRPDPSGGPGPVRE